MNELRMSQNYVTHEPPKHDPLGAGW